VGEHGLPLIGTGDWNDGMTRVGAMGRGGSVWLGWFLYATLVAFAPLARARGQRTRETQWLTHAATLRSSLERESWDGEWYRRGCFDHRWALGLAGGAGRGSDAVGQALGVIDGGADPFQGARA